MLTRRDEVKLKFVKRVFTFILLKMRGEETIGAKKSPDVVLHVHEIPKSYHDDIYHDILVEKRGSSK